MGTARSEGVGGWVGGWVAAAGSGGGAGGFTHTLPPGAWSLALRIAYHVFWPVSVKNQGPASGLPTCAAAACSLRPRAGAATKGARLPSLPLPGRLGAPCVLARLEEGCHGPHAATCALMASQNDRPPLVPVLMAGWHRKDGVLWVFECCRHYSFGVALGKAPSGCKSIAVLVNHSCWSGGHSAGL